MIDRYIDRKRERDTDKDREGKNGRDRERGTLDIERERYFRYRERGRGRERERFRASATFPQPPFSPSVGFAAIHASQPTSSILPLKFPPPPCAVLLIILMLIWYAVIVLCWFCLPDLGSQICYDDDSPVIIACLWARLKAWKCAMSQYVTICHNPKTRNWWIDEGSLQIIFFCKPFFANQSRRTWRLDLQGLDFEDVVASLCEVGACRNWMNLIGIEHGLSWFKERC